MFLLSGLAIASPEKVLNSAVLDAEQKNWSAMEKHFQDFNSFNKEDITNVIEKSHLLAFEQQFFLMGMLARYPQLELLLQDCLKIKNDVIQAICVAAYIEHLGQKEKGADVFYYQKLQDLIRSKDKTAQQIALIPLTGNDYYTPEMMEVMDDFLNQLAVENEGLYFSILYISESLADLNLQGLTKSQQLKTFSNWRKNNIESFKPSEIEVTDKLFYQNYLFQFQMKLPLEFEQLKFTKLNQGKRAVFSNLEGLFVKVETHPIQESLKSTFEEINQRLNIENHNYIKLNGYEAIEFFSSFEGGVELSRLVITENRTYAFGALSVTGSSSIEELRSLLNSIKIK
jgi:hypothetical protein